MTSFARTPYGALGMQEIIAEVMAGRTLPQPAACPAVMFAAMQRCWQAAPAARPTLGALAAELGRLHDEAKQAGSGTAPQRGGGASVQGWDDADVAV